MTPWLQDADVTLYHGDVLEVLRDLPAESVDCCVTSPPYWGLRDYGTAKWEGGDAECDHTVQGEARKFTNGRGEGVDDEYAESNLTSWTYRDATPKATCPKCGAHRVDGQLGLEPTPEEYVTRMVEVFREVRRVLAAHGTVWLNLGDTYNSRLDGSHGGWNGSSPEPQVIDERGPTNRWQGQQRQLAQKNLMGMPWRVAFALQDDGWILRSDIIWAKPNPMPESVTDRPTKAHEYVFLLSKQPRYFFDQEAVREAAQWERWGDQTNGKHEGSQSAASWIKPKSKQELTGESRPGGRGDTYSGFNERWNEDVGAAIRGRNIRSVWEIATQPYPEAHFATFPEELARRCIAAGCPENGTVLDPFIGSGTVAHVARKLGRHAVGIDLNESYLELAARRLQQQSLFADVT